MPIIIDCGDQSKNVDYDSDDSYEAKKNKKLGGVKNKSQQQDSKDSSKKLRDKKNRDDTSNTKENERNNFSDREEVAKDMDDVLNLKVYTVKMKTEPFYIDPTKVTYGEKKEIGEKFAVEDDDIVLRSYLNQDRDEDGDGVRDPTLMQRIKIMQASNMKYIDKAKSNTSEYFRNGYNQVHRVQAGNTIVIADLDVCDVIEWAVTNVNHNEDGLITSLYDFHEYAVKLNELQEKLSPRGKDGKGTKDDLPISVLNKQLQKSSPRAKSPTNMTPNLNRNSSPDSKMGKAVVGSNQNEGTHHRHKNTAAFLSNQLDKMELENRAHFMHAISIKPPPREDSTQDLNFKTGGGRNRRPSSSHLSASSASTQQIITSPIPPPGSKSTKQASMRRGSSFSSHHTVETATGGGVGAAAAAAIAANKSNLRSEKIVENDDSVENSGSTKDNDDASENENEDDYDGDSSGETQKKVSVEKSVSNSNKVNGTLISSGIDTNTTLIIKLGHDATKSGARDDKTENNINNNNNSNSNNSNKSNKNNKNDIGVVKSKFASDSTEGKVNVGPIKYTGKITSGEINYDRTLIPLSGQKEIEYQEAQTKSNTTMIQYELNKRKENMKSLVEDIHKEIDVFDGATKRLIRNWGDFNKKQEKSYADMVHTCTDHKFNRSSTIEAKMSVIDWEKMSNKGVLHEMRKLNYAANLEKENAFFANILKCAWFLKGLTGLKEFSKKTHNQLPPNCVKFLVVVQEVLQRGYTITHKSFYMLLERTIDPADHIQLIVHRAIKFVRDAINVGPETFLKYLQSKNITPCPELLSLIRNLKKVRLSTKFRPNINKKSNSNSRQSLMNTASMNSIGENSEQLDDRDISTPRSPRGGILNNNEDTFTIASSENASEDGDTFEDS